MPIHAASFHLPAAYILFFPVPLYSLLLLLVLLFSSPAWACMAHMNSTSYWPVLLLLLHLHHLLSLDYNNSLILRPRFKLISLRVQIEIFPNGGDKSVDGFSCSFCPLLLPMLLLFRWLGLDVMHPVYSEQWLAVIIPLRGCHMKYY